MKNNKHVISLLGLTTAFIITGCDPTAAQKAASDNSGGNTSTASIASATISTPTASIRSDLTDNETFNTSTSSLIDSGIVSSGLPTHILKYRVVDSKNKPIDPAAIIPTLNNDGSIDSLNVNFGGVIGIYSVTLTLENSAGVQASLKYRVYQNPPPSVSWSATDDGKAIYFNINDAIKLGIAPSSSITMGLISAVDAKGGKIDPNKSCNSLYDKAKNVNEVDCISGVTGGSVVFSDGKNKTTVNFTVPALARGKMIMAAPMAAAPMMDKRMMAAPMGKAF